MSSNLKSWNDRPFEVRNLFNPAFCGGLLYNSLKEFKKHNSSGIPYSLVLLILPLSLHKSTREKLCKYSRRHLLRILDENPEMLINFPDRVRSLLPYTMEALGLLLQYEAIHINEHGHIDVGLKRVKKLTKSTDETLMCQKAAILVGKHFSRINDRVTIYTTLGIRP